MRPIEQQRKVIMQFGSRRVLLGIGLLAVLVPISLLVGLRGYSAAQAEGRIYSFADVPSRPVAIVFGALVYPDGSPSPMLADRVAAAVKLYQAGKVKALLFTGDNHIVSYNEPEAMRQYALSLGVPMDAIVLDYAGFRTYDSCYRARDIFKVDKAILVTQAFHLDRALLTCNSLGIDSVGVAADFLRPEGYAKQELILSEVREFPSTTLAVFDLLRGAKPTFLGKPLPIVVKTSFPDNFVNCVLIFCVDWLSDPSLETTLVHQSGSVLEQPNQSFFGHDDNVNSVAWSPDGHQIASGSVDGSRVCLVCTCQTRVYY